MKKFIAILFVLICIPVLIFLCYQTKNGNTSPKFSFDENGNYKGFSELPVNYTIEDAKKDGFFVTQDSEVIANIKVWYNFVNTSLCRKDTGIRMIHFYTENAGGPYFIDLFYENGNYYLFDSSAVTQEKQPYLYLLTLKGQWGNPLKDSGIVVLTNDDTLTFDKVMGAMISSNMDNIKSISPFRIVMFE